MILAIIRRSIKFPGQCYSYILYVIYENEQIVHANTTVLHCVL